MKRKLLIRATSLLGFVIIFIMIFIVWQIVSQKLSYEVYGPVSLANSKYFNINSIRINHQTIESSHLDDYVVVTVDIENKSPKTLHDFQMIIRFDDEFQKFAPNVTSESSKFTLSGKSEGLDDLSNFANFTSENLIVKPHFLDEADRRKMQDLIHNMTIELSWQTGKEILLVSESDISKPIDFSN